jgi:CheY-like chemotaxis protein
MLPFDLLKDEECFRAVKSKILVVDDNCDIRELLVLHLRQSSYDAIEAATSLEAVTQARAIRPDLILMDLAMPDGIEAIATLKADPLTQDMPVIVVTAFLHGVLLDAAIAAGAAEILRKPLNLNWLDLVLQRHLSYQPEIHLMPKN